MTKSVSTTSTQSRRSSGSAAAGVVAVTYGVVAYLAFLVVLAYMIAFLADAIVPRSVDHGLASSSLAASVIDTALLTLFAVQHSVMARPAFKRRWTRIVPVSAERSTYVLVTAAVLALLFWQWRPIDGIIWELHGGWVAAVWVIFALGWALAVLSTFLIDHFELFGLAQTTRAARGLLPAPAAFRTPLLYRLVRHPLMVGFFVVLWATPSMSIGHLLLAMLASAYIVVAVRFEEHDLMRTLPEYGVYAARTPRFCPIPRPKSKVAIPLPTTDSSRS